MVNQKPWLCVYTGYSNVFTNSSGYGSEIALISLSRYLQKYFRIGFFSPLVSEISDHDGICNSPSNTLIEFANHNEIEIFIIWRYIHYFVEYPVVGKKNYLWVHDVCVNSYYLASEFPNYSRDLYLNISHHIDKTVVVSGVHLEIFKSLYPEIPSDELTVIGNGFQLENFVNDDKIDRIKKKFIYLSNPTRGLDKVVKYLYPFSVIHRDLVLDVYRGEDEFAGNENFLVQLKKIPWIRFHGKVDQKILARSLKSSDCWFYPTAFVETYCMSGLEALLGGCICIGSNVGALKDLLGEDKGVILQGELYSQEFDVDVNRVLTDLFDGKLERYRNGKGREWALKQTWENKSKEWLSLFSENGEIYLPIQDLRDLRDLRDLKILDKETQWYNPNNILSEIVVINLEKRKDRWKSFCERCPLESKRWIACNGRELFLDHKIAQRFDYPKNFVPKIAYGPHEYRVGAIGCALSHYSIWEEMERSNLDEVVVFEDDVYFKDDFVENLTKIREELSNDLNWDILYLGYHDEEEINEYPDLEISTGVKKFCFNLSRIHIGGTFAMIVRKKGAIKLLEVVKKEKITQPLDHFIFSNFDNLEIYRCYPTLVVSDSFYNKNNVDSDIQNCFQKIRGYR